MEARPKRVHAAARRDGAWSKDGIGPARTSGPGAAPGVVGLGVEAISTRRPNELGCRSKSRFRRLSVESIYQVVSKAIVEGGPVVRARGP